jgi:hypothetical protein
MTTPEAVSSMSDSANSPTAAPDELTEPTNVVPEPIRQQRGRINTHLSVSQITRIKKKS